MNETSIQNGLGKISFTFLFAHRNFRSFKRHIELTSPINNVKYIFTTVKYAAISQGKIGFNTLQVIFHEKYSVF